MKTIGQLNYGSKIRFGSYSVNGEPRHPVCWIKASIDKTILVTEMIEDILPFDSPEPDNPEYLPRQYGNALYETSNIHQFLNSDKERWYKKAHEYDASPTDRRVDNAYFNHPGFLSYFTDAEKNVIMDSVISVGTWKTNGNAEHYFEYHNIIAKVFIPSAMELCIPSLEENRIGEEGEPWESFIIGCTAKITAQVKTFHLGYWRAVNTYSFYVRSKVSGDDTSYAAYIDRNGTISRCEAKTSNGVRPALAIKPDTQVSDQPDDDGYYTLILNEKQDEEFAATWL